MMTSLKLDPSRTCKGLVLPDCKTPSGTKSIVKVLNQKVLDSSLCGCVRVKKMEQNEAIVLE